MKNALKIAVLGGDRRNFFAAENFMKKGWDVSLYGVPQEGRDLPKVSSAWEKAVSEADVVLLPLPLSKDGISVYAPAASEKILLSDLFSLVKKDALLFGGGCTKFEDERFIDYAKRESFALFNAVPTAEGALLLALQQMEKTIFGMRVGILGFGRIGSRAAAVFHALGAEVSVFARKADVRISATLQGYHAYDFFSLQHEISSFDLLINTVPVRLLQEDLLREIQKECLILDLASAPFGLDFDETERMGLHAICACALPGKYFPESAGKIIADTVMEILKEKSILF